MNGEFGVDALVELAAWELIARHSLDEIESLLIQEGVASGDSLKLTLLIPSAFAREYFEPEGIGFPDEFLVGEPGAYVVRRYEDEPIYLAARRLARRWLDEQRPSLVGRVLDWSSEAEALKLARDQGLTPDRLDMVHHGFLE